MSKKLFKPCPTGRHVYRESENDGPDNGVECAVCGKYWVIPNLVTPVKPSEDFYVPIRQMAALDHHRAVADSLEAA